VAKNLVCPGIIWGDEWQPIGAELLANARLIAAAPDLYAALVAVVAVADRSTVEFDAARAALSLARGEKP
jgi:hypothetical protein